MPKTTPQTAPAPASPPRRWRRFAWIAGIGVAGMIVLWLGLSLAMVWKLTKRPHAQTATPMPEVTWATIEPLTLTTDDGLTLGAWWIAGQSDRPAAILLHGNGGGRQAMLSRAELWAKQGCPVLLITMRAHGDSGGQINDFGYSARLDVLAAAKAVRERRASDSDARLYVHGWSLGAAAALFASGELAGQADGYLLESPYRDLWTAASNRTRQKLPPGLAELAALGLRLTAPAILESPDRIAPVDAAPQVAPNARVLIFAGEADIHAPAADARAIFSRLPQTTAAKLITIPEADHRAMMFIHAQQHQTAMQAAIKQWCQPVRAR